MPPTRTKTGSLVVALRNDSPRNPVRRLWRSWERRLRAATERILEPGETILALVPGHYQQWASRLLALTDRRLIAFRGNLISRPKELLFADPYERIVAVDYAPVHVGETYWKTLTIHRDNGEVHEVTPWIGYEGEATTIHKTFAPAEPRPA